MMLLQAGQMGLANFPIRFTEALAPEMISGCTLWIDCTDNEYTYQGAVLTGGNATAEYDPVGSVRSKSPGTSVCLTGMILDNTRLRKAVTNSKDVMEMLGNSGNATGGELFSSTILPLNHFWTDRVKLVIAAIRVSAASNHQSGSPWGNDVIFGDSGYSGLHITDNTFSTSGTLVARAFNYVGGAVHQASVNVPRNEFAVLTMSHQSNQLRIRANGGAWAQRSSGVTDAIGSAAKALRLEASSRNPSIQVAHLATWNTPLADGGIAAVERWIANDIGITPWW